MAERETPLFLQGMASKILRNNFYRRDDVLEICRDLIGKVICTRFDGMYTSGRIVEAEAYAGITDRASHAWGGRYTARTKTMYEAGGITYVYLCYGIHHLFNVVTNKTGVPHAILIRALEPLEGLPLMLQRTGKKPGDTKVTSGPGNLTRALGITTSHNGVALIKGEIELYDDGYTVSDQLVAAVPRVGVDYAGEDALLPYRYYLKGNPWVSALQQTR